MSYEFENNLSAKNAFFVVKHRTNTYFRQTEYAERNNVYTHKYATNTYILQKTPLI